MNKNYMYMYRILEQLKHQSECIDKQVACIITDEFYNIVSTGINTIIECNRDCHNKESRICNVDHAEIKAIENMNPYSRRYYAFINLFPCAPCQIELKNKGIQKIISFTPKHKEQVFKNIEIVDNLSDMLLNNNGQAKQLSVAQGELCELVTSISDYFYRPEKKMVIEDILDEIVDVELMLTQIKKILWLGDRETYNKLREIQKEKYLKLLKKINLL